MVKIQKCKRHGICNDCGKKQDDEDDIFEIKVSLTGQGWNTIMLCRACMMSLHTTMAIAATQNYILRRCEMRATLIMDMPECCGNCLLMDDDPSGGYCIAHDDDYIDIPDTMEGKPEWCPLHPLPQPMDVCGKYPQPGRPVPSYRIGWNDCLEKITNQDFRENGRKRR